MTCSSFLYRWLILWLDFKQQRPCIELFCIYLHNLKCYLRSGFFDAIVFAYHSHLPQPVFIFFSHISTLLVFYETTLSFPPYFYHFVFSFSLLLRIILSNISILMLYIHPRIFPSPLSNDTQTYLNNFNVIPAFKMSLLSSMSIQHDQSGGQHLQPQISSFLSLVPVSYSGYCKHICDSLSYSASNQWWHSINLNL